MPNETLRSNVGGDSTAAALFEVPQVFHVLRETPCPYLPGRWERKIMTELRERDGQATYATLSRGGFRRSHQFAYRPACASCDACVPVRVEVGGFAPSKSLRRVARRNADLTATELPARGTEEQFQLFSRYLASRHGDGEMVEMDASDYRSMVEDTVVDSSLIEFRDDQGQLLAVCLTDWIDQGPSAVYSFFAPDASARGLGTYCVLWLIEEARRRGDTFVYLGYWIAGARKMAYKTRFQPLQCLRPGGWTPLELKGRRTS